MAEKRAALVLTAGVMVLLTAIYVTPGVPAGVHRAVSGYLLDLSLLPFAVLALLGAAFRQRDAEVGAFYRRLGLGYLAWLVAAVVRWPLDQIAPGVAEPVRDTLYGLYYLSCFWAIEWMPLGRQRSEAERRYALAGSLLLVGGSLVYLRILPSFGADIARQTPYHLLYGALDLYLATRLALLAVRARGSRLGAALGLLTAAGFLIAIGDAVEAAASLHLIGHSEASLLNLVWLAPYVPLVLAARVRGLELPVAVRRLDTLTRSVSTLWSPLIAYGFALPAVHVALYTTGWGHPEAERVRGLFVLSWLIVLALVLVLQRAAMVRRVAGTEVALREASGRIRELVRAREAAGEEERRRLARELHDGLGQILVALQLDFAWLARRSEKTRGQLGRRLIAAGRLARSALESARGIALGLRPLTLDDLGLSAALEELAAQAAGSGVDVKVVEGDEELRLTPEAETAFFRIAEESVGNSLRHARASRIEICLSGIGGRARLEIRDNGTGLETTAEASDRIGLLIMEERVQAFDGSLELGKGIDGAGLCIRAELPLS